jgi:RAB protein geranylgeranyltransferase component A
MPDGRSLYDLFGFEWTLLAFAAPALQSSAGLKVLHLDNPEARDLYGADFALIRPDQIVAWRGNVEKDATAVFRRLTE